MSKLEPQRGLIPDRLVGERYGRGAKTIERWGRDPKLSFPPVVYVRGRRYRSVEALDAWDAKQCETAGAA
jgi:hypothetical protein